MLLLITLTSLAIQDVGLTTPDPEVRSPRTIQSLQVRPDGSANLNDERCATLLRRVSPGSLPEPPRRVGEERVRMYHLLDRRIDGCQAPLVVSHDLPEANAARGRNLARH